VEQQQARSARAVRELNLGGLIEPRRERAQLHGDAAHGGVTGEAEVREGVVRRQLLEQQRIHRGGVAQVLLFGGGQDRDLGPRVADGVHEADALPEDLHLLLGVGEGIEPAVGEEDGPADGVEIEGGHVAEQPRPPQAPLAIEHRAQTLEAAGQQGHGVR